MWVMSGDQKRWKQASDVTEIITSSLCLMKTRPGRRAGPDWRVVGIYRTRLRLEGSELAGASCVAGASENVGVSRNAQLGYVCVKQGDSLGNMDKLSSLTSENG
jgi:hypothetical protein